MSVLDEIAAKRVRQIERHGYDAAHDDAHTDGSIAKAAAAYAAAGVSSATGAMLWPWRIDEFKPTNARENLLNAAALCIAEIERLDRVPCPVCRGSGFSGYGTGYGSVCGECGGQSRLNANTGG